MDSDRSKSELTVGVNNCPILERTGDGRMVGRCWYYLRGGECPRHGDVTKYRDRYIETGKLTDENEMRQDHGERQLRTTASGE